LARWRTISLSYSGVNPLNAELNPIFHLLALLGARHILHVSRIRVNDVRQTELHTAKPLVPETSAVDVELAIEKLKSHKSPGIDHIPAELIKAGGRPILSEIHKLIISIWNKENLPERSGRNLTL
jgi:hypothetical protein